MLMKENIMQQINSQANKRNSNSIAAHGSINSPVITTAAMVGIKWPRQWQSEPKNIPKQDPKQSILNLKECQEEFYTIAKEARWSPIRNSGASPDCRRGPP